MRAVCTIFLLLVSLNISAQDVTGKWVGNYSYNFLSSRPDKLVIEILLYNDTMVSGTSHLYHGRDKYEHYTISGVYRKADSTIYFKEDSTIGVKLGMFVENVLGTYAMKLRYTDTAMRFEGRWKENNEGLGLMNCKVWLEKPLPKKPASENSTSQPQQPAMPDRAIAVQKLIEISEAEKDSIKISILDNGQIDGDIVSVYMNDTLLLQNKQLTAKSHTLYININKDNPLCRLTMVSESEGSIPPCTARLTVYTKTKHYDIDLSSDGRKSGTIQFFLKE